MRIGVDTGGTFTDLIAIGEGGQIAVAKVRSTPTDPSQAVEDGLRELAPKAAFSLVHGTTVATNSLLERRGARTALLTTEGCRDVLEIARQTRDSLYDLTPAPRAPLIARELRFEATERIDWQGTVIVPLDTASLNAALDAIQAAGVESLAVCFLFSFLDPTHELEAGRHARKRGLSVSLSHEIAPEFREYERTSTVAANAFVAPVMERYLDHLAKRVERLGSSRLSVMQSNGGTLRADEAARVAVKTVLSGPAGGLVAAARTARDAGIARIVTFDMGGTSTDVALLEDTRSAPPTMRTGEVAGLPLLTPMLDIHTVGAGGGSIARVDAGGGLRVGPESAGAEPGPVVYGTGDRLTVTDANVMLGRLPSAARLAGTLPLDVDRVGAHFARLGAKLGVTPERAAEGVVQVANATMARALRHISVERGHDPRSFTLVSFGGAGGLHACALADALGIGRILVPPAPGAFSALGLAIADVRREYTRSLFVPAEARHDAAVRDALASMARTARTELAAEDVPPGNVVLERFVEARYVGQSYALRVPFGPSGRGLDRAARAFHRAHRARYGHADPNEPVEIVTVGLTAAGTDRHAVLPSATTPAPYAGAYGPATANVYTAGEWMAAPVVDRAGLSPVERLAGPAVLLQPDATTWIEPGWTAEADAHGNLRLWRD